MGFAVQAAALGIIVCGCIIAGIALTTSKAFFYIQCACAAPTPARRPPAAALIAVPAGLLLSSLLQHWLLALLGLDHLVAPGRCRRAMVSLGKVATFASMVLLGLLFVVVIMTDAYGRFCCFGALDQALIVAGASVIAVAALANFFLGFADFVVREDELVLGFPDAGGLLSCCERSFLISPCSLEISSTVVVS